MRNNLTSCVLLLALPALYGQNDVCFAYDVSGNRIRRESCCTQCQATPGNSAAQFRQSSGEQAWITIAPNPAFHEIQLNWSGFSQEANWVLSDNAGKIIRHGHLQHHRITIAELPPGKYFLSVKEANRNHITSFIKIQ
jgi:hypothetical protein